MFSSLQLPRASRRARALGATMASIVLLAALVPVATASGPTNPQATSVHLRKIGTTRMVTAAPGSPGSSLSAATEIPNTDVLERTPKSAGGSGGSLTVPIPTPVTVTSNNPGLFGFNGLSHYDSRTASGGNQYSLEPPDQGLCVGNGYVVETINDVTAVYSAGGSLLAGPTALNAFYGYSPSIDRSASPLVFGPFMTDPKCLYDASTDRFYMSELTLDTDPSTGAFTGTTHVDLAVSQSGDPTGDWTIFSFDTTNGNGTAPGHPGCPCLGDQPLLGADANGIFISTNEFPFFNPGFNGTQLYGISKSELASAATGATGTLPAVWYDNVGALPTPDSGGIWYSLQPATSPGQWDTSNGGTEYFLSALDFFGAGDNRIAAWALTNTSSLNSASPQLTLQDPAVLTTEPYGAPYPFGVTQKDGPTPLRDALAALGYTDSLAQLNANDDRMNQVVYANGQLWAGLNTALGTPGTAGTAGIAYFVVNPRWQRGAFSPRLQAQNYVSVAGDSVIFPSIGVTPGGSAVMTFTLVGPDYFPTAAYAMVTPGHVGPVHIAGAGQAPDDGFTAYAAFGGDGIGRWGDYSAAVADSSGNIWFAAEYIPNTPRTLLANWGTFIGRVAP